MGTISIPEPALPGFGVLQDLSEDQFEDLIRFLDGVSVVDKREKIQDFFDTIVEKDNGVNLFLTISSFSRLVKPGVSMNELASDLSASYAEQTNFQDQQIIDVLQERLSKILNKYAGLGEYRKARTLQFRNEIILNETTMLTDIRMVFSDDIHSDRRAAIIMHKLNITFTKDDLTQNVYYTLDLDDLRQLKIEIEKSIQKEEILRTSYKDTLTFIN